MDWRELATNVLRRIHHLRQEPFARWLDGLLFVLGVWLVLWVATPRLTHPTPLAPQNAPTRLLPTPALAPIARIPSPTPRPTLPPPPTATPTPTPTATPTPPPTTLHTVQQGETLLLIARRYETTVDAIRQANALETDFLQIGQELIIPLDPNAIPNPPTPTPTPTATPTLAPGEQQYTVQAGDTLFAIAQRFGVSAERIQTRNRLDDATALRVGQRLIIPAPERTAPPTPTHAPLQATLPAPTATPTPLPAPRLLAPANTAILTTETPPRLIWRAPPLPEDAWFEVMLWRDGEPPAARGWTRATEWVLTEDDRGATWNWRVRIVQGVWGVMRQPLSHPSETWRFTWR